MAMNLSHLQHISTCTFQWSKNNNDSHNQSSTAYNVHYQFQFKIKYKFLTEVHIIQQYKNRKLHMNIMLNELVNILAQYRKSENFQDGIIITFA